MAIRNAMTFNRRPVQHNVFVSKQNINVHHCNPAPQNNGLGLMFGLSAGLSLLSGIFSIFGGAGRTAAPSSTPAAPAQPKENLDFQNLEKIAKSMGYVVIQNSEGDYTAWKDGLGFPITGDYEYVKNEMLKGKTLEKEDPDKVIKDQADDAVVDGNTGDDGLGGAEVWMEENPSNMETVKTIKFGGPWHYAQYYTDANGKQLEIGSSEFNAVMNAIKQQMGEVKDNKNQRVLPKEITINGQTYSLMGAEQREALGLEGQKGEKDTRYQVISNGSTWSVYKKENGVTTLLGDNLTKEQAEKTKAEAEALEANSHE